MSSTNSILKYSFLNSLPVMFGFIFLGTAYGICLQQAGYGLIWAFLTSVFIFAGSAQFAIASMIAFGTSLPTIALMVLFINSRHIFYGISFIDDFKKMKTRPYMIFSLTDETYSVLTLCRKDPMIYENNNQAMFLIALFNQSYWVLGSMIGSICGLICGTACLFIFGADKFILPALIVTVFVLSTKTMFERKPVVIQANSEENLTQEQN